MQTTEFKMVPLKSIKPDPNQPRKFYDETAMQELTASVQEKGILQPILIRPNGKGYILVCGERRTRAANAAGLTEIPAVIREITDEEALEMQIIENLQRKDVHPMEEAVAFKSLAEKGKDIKEIAARVGKSDYYARQRIKLCALSADWQKIFYQNRISVSDAMKVAMFDEDTQAKVYKDEADGSSRIVALNSWTMRKYEGSLSYAPFDLNDANLDKKMGACIGCKFNSATALLFEDAAASPKCSKIDCFSNKVELNFNRQIVLAQENPEVILVHDDYGSSNSKAVAKAVKEGHIVYSRRDYNIIEKPEFIEWDEWREDNEDDYEVSEEDLKNIYQKEAVADYEKELREYEEKIAGGKFKKAFMMSGNQKGAYVYVNITRSSKDTKAKEQAGTLSVEDINAEIQRLKDREKRAKELDNVKFWDSLKSNFRPAVNVPGLKGDFSVIEREAIANAIYNKINYSSKDDFRKLFKVDGRKQEIIPPDEETLRSMIRFFFLDVLPPNVIYSQLTDDALLSIKVAGEYFPSVLADIQTACYNKAARREERVNKRIAELNAKKKELQKKTTVKKKSAK